jgi:hypothetical protein
MPVVSSGHGDNLKQNVWGLFLKGIACKITPEMQVPGIFERSENARKNTGAHMFTIAFFLD